MLILVTGGARSGKSTFAEQFAQMHFHNGLYIATAIAFDAEMDERIARHQNDRIRTAFPWETIEEPLELVKVLNRQFDDKTVVLVDCLTIWLSNWLLKLDEFGDTRLLGDKIDELLETIQKSKLNLIFVTNEVGSGIVPEHRLGRIFRDYAGLLNRKLATLCRHVFLVTAGIPIDLLQNQYVFNTSQLEQNHS
jgi:adenosylcobinamide kinase/adenosylcobinamide-phosphate guanylyltransferase